MIKDSVISLCAIARVIIENKNINTKIQHPLAEIEIDCIDSSYAKIIFKDEKKFDLNKGETYEK